MRRSASAAIVVALALGLIGAASPAPRQPPSAAEAAALAAPAAPAPIAGWRTYFVMTDRYANGDPANDTGGYGKTRAQNGFDPTSPAYWHGGDFKGLTGGCTDPKRGLQRLQELGFNAIWVTPPVVNQITSGGSAGYHGYWGLDFTRVDPHLGTNDDFAAFVDCAHRLGMKVIMDVVVNHTGDVIIPSGGGSYSDVPFRDCKGRVFRADRYVNAKRFPCLAARFMPRVPYVLPSERNAKRPAWLNDPLNYHNRGNIDFGSCSQLCFEQGDFYGLDDLFTEKPNVRRGLAAVYGDWIRRYKLDGFRVDTARNVDPAFFRLWVPEILAAARAAGVPDFQLFGEVYDSDSLNLATFVRDRGLPNVLDFAFQDAAVGYAGGGTGAKAIANRLEDDDYFRLPDGRPPMPPTFLGNHDMGRAALQIAQRGAGFDTGPLLRRTLFGYDLLFLLRGAPVVYYGDEVGMIGAGGDQQARQDMFPTQVAEWKRQPRLGGPPIGDGSSFDVTGNPLQLRLRELASLRERYPALASGASVVRRAQGPVLVVSRIDAATGTELLEAFNNGATAATVTATTATPGATWTTVFGAGTATAGAGARVTVSIPPLSALLAEPSARIPSAAPPAPKLTVKEDDISAYYEASATVAGAPVTVAFAVRRAGGAWRRVASDDSAPYRAFLDPRRFRKGERVSVVAVARSLDGRVAVSRVAEVRLG